jgi:hypothetical protein
MMQFDRGTAKRLARAIRRRDHGDEALEDTSGDPITSPTQHDFTVEGMTATCPPKPLSEGGIILLHRDGRQGCWTID